MDRNKKIMAFLAAVIFGAAFNRLLDWWKDADPLKLWRVLAWLAVAMVLAGSAFLYAWL